jgi:hypothetical protein
MMRAGFAAGILFLFLALTNSSKKGQGGIGFAALFAVVAFALYAPAGYYLELFLFRRRQRRKEAAKR